MDKHPAVPREALHDKTFPAKEAREDTALEENANLHPARSREKAVFLANKRTAHSVELNRDDVTGIRRRKSHMRLACTIVREHGGKKALARDEAFASAQEFGHKALLFVRTVAEHGRHFDMWVFIHHAARLSDGRFARVQLHFNKLHLAAINGIIDVVVLLGACVVVGFFSGRQVAHAVVFLSFYSKAEAAALTIPDISTLQQLAGMLRRGTLERKYKAKARTRCAPLFDKALIGWQAGRYFDFCAAAFSTPARCLYGKVAQPMSIIWDTIKFIYKAIAGFGALMVGLFSLFFLLILLAVIGNSGKEKPILIDAGSVLVVAPTGTLTENITDYDSSERLVELLTDSVPVNTNVHELTAVIRYAAHDDSVPAMVLTTDYFAGASSAHLHQVADALKEFSASGKPIYAISIGYTQGDYLLASEADTVYINPEGVVSIEGLNSYGFYYSDLFEKLGIDVSIFRVGTHKSAVEPFSRNNMSPEARENRLGLLNSIWDVYAERVASNRGIERAALDAYLNDPTSALKAANGNFADVAIAQHFADEKLSLPEIRQELASKYGASDDGQSFKQVDWRIYQEAHADNIYRSVREKIAVIVVDGAIVPGQSAEGTAGSGTVTEKIRLARNNPLVKAVVLRVNSPGGSALASELIRQELVATQRAGKPVVASFAGVAASGGYWISATADAIYAAPSTITGSIGIFAMIPTAERGLNELGVKVDGVSTTPIGTSPLIPFQKINPQLANVIQQSIEAGYSNFLNLVAAGRKMSVEDVDAIAQGRVWDGKSALDIGLIDGLGDLETALDAAAELANMSSYSVIYPQRDLTPFEKFVKQLSSSEQAMSEWIFGAPAAASLESELYVHQSNPSPLVAQALRLKRDADLLLRLNDPSGLFVLCEYCEVQ